MTHPGLLRAGKQPRASWQCGATRRPWGARLGEREDGGSQLARQAQVAPSSAEGGADADGKAPAVTGEARVKLRPRRKPQSSVTSGGDPAANVPGGPGSTAIHLVTSQFPRPRVRGSTPRPYGDHPSTSPRQASKHSSVDAMRCRQPQLGGCHLLR